MTSNTINNDADSSSRTAVALKQLVINDIPLPFAPCAWIQKRNLNISNLNVLILICMSRTINYKSRICSASGNCRSSCCAGGTWRVPNGPTPRSSFGAVRRNGCYLRTISGETKTTSFRTHWYLRTCIPVGDQRNVDGVTPCRRDTFTSWLQQACCSETAHAPKTRVAFGEHEHGSWWRLPRRRTGGGISATKGRWQVSDGPPVTAHYR